MRALIFLACMLASAQAQENHDHQTATDQGQGHPAEPAVEEPSDNMPLSAVDMPSLVPSVATRSMLSPALEISQGVNTNPSNVSGASSVQGVTNALASVALQKQWRRQSFNLSYVGGGSFSSNQDVGATQEHEFGVVERILWRSGQLALRDFFSYLPEGSFGNGSFGGIGSLIGLGGPDTALGGALGGTVGGVLNSGQFGSVGQQPRISNQATIDVIEELSLRSSITLAGSYGLVHFTGDIPNAINSQQTSAQAGYNYQLTRRNQIGVVYAFQDFRYPAPIGTGLITHTANVMFGHQISERLDFRIGGGPQATAINDPQGGTRWTISGNGMASLRFRFSRSSVAIKFQRYNTSGSGIVAGATTEVASFTVDRQLGRSWNATADAGYARNSSILPSSAVAGQSTYSYWYAGAGLRRQIGRHFGLFASYQYNRQLYDRSFCGVNGACDPVTGRHSAFIGLDWHPTPVRLD